MPQRLEPDVIEIALTVSTTTPTEHPPGSEEKIEVLIERYWNGEPMHHDDDNKECRKVRHPATAGTEGQEEFGAGVYDVEDDE